MTSHELALKNVRKELAHMATVPVYFARAERLGEIKIGFSTQVRNRLMLLGYRHMSVMTLLGWIPGGPRVEREMHSRFDAFALGHEWFEPAPELLSFIESDTRHDEPIDVISKFGRITDWGYDDLVASERTYSEMVSPERRTA